MQMLIGGSWREGKERIEVRRPHDGKLVDDVPAAGPADVEDALAAASAAASTMAAMPAHQRASILRKAADLCDAASEDLARTISAEVGKPITEARGEAARCGEMLRLAAYEGANLRGDTLPLDSLAVPPAEDKLGFTLKQPCGVVVAITPFNFPALLVMHKIAPALATGNAVVLKPASATPLSAVMIVKMLLEAGLPETAIQLVTGSGGAIGDALCADERVRKVSFTGSVEIGERIARAAGIKKLSLELGSNSPCVVMPDADMGKVAELCAVGGYANAGQVCISLQRALVHRKVYADYVDAMKEAVGSIAVGDPEQDGTKLASMISTKEATRVDEWVREAASDGARVVTGGERNGSAMEATLVADVKPQMKLFCEETFGPVMAATPVDSLEEAISLCAVGGYGLAASIFTRDVSTAISFVRSVGSGNVHVNWTPLWRTDMMPYGGFGKSGIGKEGIRDTVESMVETKTAIIHGAPVHYPS